MNNKLREGILRRQYDNQAWLIVCILRRLLLSNDYQSAADFVAYVKFPEAAHDNIKARWNYYQGRIKVKFAHSSCKNWHKY